MQITFSSKQPYLKALAIINAMDLHVLYLHFPCGNGADFLNTFIKAGGSNGALIVDMRSEARPSFNFTNVSGDKLGMLVYTI